MILTIKMFQILTEMLIFYEKSNQMLYTRGVKIIFNWGLFCEFKKIYIDRMKPIYILTTFSTKHWRKL